MILFLYFALSSGELLNVVLGIFKPKAGHLVALILLGSFLLSKRAWQFPKPLMQAFALILGSMVLSALCGAAPMRSLGYVAVYLFNFVIYFFLPYQIMQRMDLQRFLRIYWSSFVFVGVYAALQVGLSLFGIYEPLALQRVGSLARGQAWTYEPSYYALYMIPYVMYQNGMALLQEKTNRFKLFCQNMLLIVSTSTGLIVSYPAFFLCSMFSPLRKLSNKKLRAALVTFLVSIVAVTIFFYETALHTLFKFFYFGLTHGSFMARWDGIVASCKTFLKHPLLGSGLGGVSTERFIDESTYDFKLITLQEFEAYDPTNCLTEVMASLGLVGLCAFIYLGVVFYRAFQEVLQDDSIDLPVKKTATALFLSLVVMLIALQMNQGLFRPYVWIYAAVVFGYLGKVRAEGAGKLHHVEGLL